MRIAISEGEVGKKVVCPHCLNKISAMAFISHLKERHGLRFSLSPTEFTKKKGSEVKGTGDEWGEPFTEINRTRVSKEADVHHGEINQATTSEGEPVNLEAKSREFFLETRREFRRNGIDPRYMGVKGNKSTVQFTGSPIPAAVVTALVVAIIALIIAAAIYVTTEAIWNIAPVPDWAKPAVGIAVLGFAGYITYKIVS